MQFNLQRLKKRDFWINPYTLIIAIFAVWMAFFDRSSLLQQHSINKTVQSLEQDIRDYDQLYEEALRDRKNLDENAERYAREHHNFSKKGEEIFIIK